MISDLQSIKHFKTDYKLLISSISAYIIANKIDDEDFFGYTSFQTDSNDLRCAIGNEAYIDILDIAYNPQTYRAKLNTYIPLIIQTNTSKDGLLFTISIHNDLLETL